MLHETYDKHVAKLIKPKVVDRRRSKHKLPIGKVLVEFGRRVVEFMQDPSFYE